MSELMKSDLSKADIQAQDDLAALQRQRKPYSDQLFEQILTRNRTVHGWQPGKEISDDAIRQMYMLVSYMPTSFNMQPARFLFLKSTAAKEKLKPALARLNVEQTLTAPLVVIIGYDTAFYEHFEAINPPSVPFAQKYRDNPDMAERNAFRNGTLQAAALLLVARALGYEVGPMSGFNNALVDSLFFSGTQIKSNFLCNIGYGDPTSIKQRLPRLEFDHGSQIL